jgi:hypothetical protein
VSLPKERIFGRSEGCERILLKIVNRKSQSSSDALRDETKLVKRPARRTTVSDETDFGQISPLRRKIIERIQMNQDLKLRDLIQDVSIEGGFRTEAVMREIMNMEDEGLISMSESSQSTNLAQYMVSPNSIWFLGSIAVIAVAIVLVFLPIYLLSFFAEPFIYLRYFFGGILVLFIPGYALMESIFPNRSQFDDLTKYALSFVMSLALVILVSLVLGVSPVGLETLPITVSVALLSLILLFVALKRKYDYYEIAHHFDQDVM